MDVKSEIRSGTFWLVGFKYAGLIVQIIISAILARLLSPEEFGIVAIVTVFVNFFILLSDSGIGSAVIQRINITESETFSLLIITIFFGLFLAIVFWFMGSFISQFYSNPAYTRIAHLLSVSFFFYTANTIPASLLFKQKKFKQSGIINISVQCLVGIVTIVLAYSGFSYNSLLYGNILSSALIFLINLKVVKIKFFRTISFNIFQQIFNYSVFQWLFNIVNYFSRNLDNLLIGKYLSVAALGNYDKSYSLIMMPVSHITRTISTVLHPVLSEFQNNIDFIYDVYKKVVKYLNIIGAPLSIFMFFSSYEIINVLYGSQWNTAVTPFKYLSLTVGIQIVLVSSGSMFLLLNKTNYLLYVGIINSLFFVTAIILGIFIGRSINSVAFLLIFAFFINLFIAYYFLISKLFKKKLGDFLKTLFPGSIIGSSLLIAFIIFNQFFVFSFDPLIMLIIKIIIAATVFYFMIELIGERKNLISLFKSKKQLKNDF
jgi:PST family polysaccharide transporter